MGISGKFNPSPTFRRALRACLPTAKRDRSSITTDDLDAMRRLRRVPRLRPPMPPLFEVKGSPRDLTLVA